MVRATWSARAAANSSASASAVQRSASPSSNRARIASAPGLPPGSRVSTTSRPRARNAAATAFAWVDLPTPSPPSRVTKRPGMSAQTEQAREARPDAAEKAGLADRLLGDQRSRLGRHVAGLDAQVGDMLALGARRLDRALIDDARGDPLLRTGGKGDGERARRDQADCRVAAELDLRLP